LCIFSHSPIALDKQGIEEMVDIVGASPPHKLDPPIDYSSQL